MTCLLEPAEAIVGARSPRVHGLDFAEHIGKKPLVALTRVIEPHHDSGEGAHVIAQAGHISDKPFILASKKVQIGVDYSRPYSPASTASQQPAGVCARLRGLRGAPANVPHNGP